MPGGATPGAPQCPGLADLKDSRCVEDRMLGRRVVRGQEEREGQEEVDRGQVGEVIGHRAVLERNERQIAAYARGERIYSTPRAAPP